ncbi:putative oxidoreductase EphD [bacterium HR19]|nr:putative oxidoreductase EphD [bacterium HR19]
MKRALITGGSYGIGYALAKKFAKNGVEVILIARTEEKLLEVKKEIEKDGGKSYIFPADLTKTNLEELFNRIYSEYEFDTLVNNAGFGTIGKFYELDIKKELEMIELNVKVLVELSHHFLSRRIKEGKGGTLINISSLAGFFPIPYFATYSATKAFVLSFSEAIRREVEDKKIKVITICPGGVKTEFQKRAGIKDDIYSLQNYLTADELADYVWEAVKKSKSPFVPGPANKIYSYIVRITPIPLITKLGKIFMKMRLK